MIFLLFWKYMKVWKSIQFKFYNICRLSWVTFVTTVIFIKRWLRVCIHELGSGDPLKLFWTRAQKCSNFLLTAWFKNARLVKFVPCHIDFFRDLRSYSVEADSTNLFTSTFYKHWHSSKLNFQQGPHKLRQLRENFTSKFALVELCPGQSGRQKLTFSRVGGNPIDFEFYTLLRISRC
jgi:hypothetical protein